MAFTRNPTYQLTISFVDRDGNKGSTEFFVDTVNTILEVITAIETNLIPAVQALSDAVVTGWSLTSSASDREPATPAETSDIERKGVFSFLADNGATYTLQIPSIKNSLVVDGSNIIDRSQAAVTTFINMVLSTSILALARPRTYLGSDIKSLQNTPNKKHRRNTRG